MVKKTTKNIRSIFSISLIILLLSSAASYFSIVKLLESEKWVDHTFSVIEKLDFIISRMKDAETGQRGYLLSGDEQFLEPYNGSQNEVMNALNEAERLTQDNQSQQKDFPKLESLIDHKYKFIKKTIKDEKIGIPVTTATLLAGKSVMDSIRSAIKVMEKREKVLLQVRQSKMSKMVSYTPILIAIGALISMCIAFIFYKRIERDMGKTALLENELKQKEADTKKQIEVITDMAKKITEGNYKERTNQ